MKEAINININFNFVELKLKFKLRVVLHLPMDAFTWRAFTCRASKLLLVSLQMKSDQKRLLREPNNNVSG